MKPKLKVFEDFSKTLLPHEAKYLSSLSNFQDSEKKEIFENLIHNSLYPEKAKHYRSDIDKRKYHYIKKWAEGKLHLRDVDQVADWLLELNRKLALDLLTSEEEKALLEYVRNYRTITFNFQILYRLIRDYRSYLLIRMRYDDHITVSGFLSKYQDAYLKACEIEEKLYQATIEITDQFTHPSKQTVYWEKWLKKVFSSEEVNGSNRYKAFILLAFMYNTMGNLGALQQIFDQIDSYFTQGKLYCRRLLYNYYSSRVLLHSRQRDYDAAVFYGKLSIRQHNEDTLMYVNNLVSIYLRMDQPRDAMQLLDTYQQIYENSQNNLQRVIYISCSLRAMTDLNLNTKAENIGLYFLQKYEQDILKLRWHHFFTSYCRVLFKNEKYSTLVRLEKKYGLCEREQTRRRTDSFVPNLFWMITVAQFLENKISHEKLVAVFKDSLADFKLTDANEYLVKENIVLLTKNLPELTGLFKSHLKKMF